MKMMKKIYWIIQDFGRQAGKKNIGAYASSTAFFLFLSIVPMLILICTIIPYTPLTEADLLNAVSKALPEKVIPLAENVVAEVYDQSIGILSVAALTTLWSAGKGVLALMRGLNVINNVEEKRNYFLIRVICSVYTFILLIATILSLLLMVFGNQLVNLLLYDIPQLKVLVSFLMNFRFIAVWVILTALFSLIYAYVPGKRLVLREQLPGAAFAAVVWSIFSWGFSLYVGWGAAYSIYGSLSIVIIVMFWMYFCMYIILMGAYMNRYFTEEGEALLEELH